MTEASSYRGWMPPDVAAFVAQHDARYAALPLAALDEMLFALVDAHEQHLDTTCINLYAGTNIPNPRSARLLGSTIGSRPNLGYPGDKYNKGMQHADQIEVLLTHLLRRAFGAKYVEHRVGSGSLANLYAYMATTRPGDPILAFGDAAAGHPTHHAVGAAGLYGLQVHEVPFDSDRMDIDLDGLARVAHDIRPKLIIVAGSMCLFPYNVAGARAVADDVGAYLLYDAAHMGGLIAGGQFQQPLAEGAHLMTGSTYKSFGGPPGGMVLTDDAELAARLDRIAFPGLTANFDLARSAALALAALDSLTYGQPYAVQCIANAQALAAALADHGVAVHHVAGRGHTASQHVAVRATAYDGGNAACKRLEAAHLLMTGIGLPGEAVAGEYNAIRIGTQEVTRWGMRETEMAQIAMLIARVLVGDEPPAQVRPDTIALRSGFQKVQFVRVEPGHE